MSRGNSRSHANSWIGYCRLSRTRITGYKKKRLGHPSEKLSGDVARAGWRTVIFSEILWPISMAIILSVAYMFMESFPVDGYQQGSAFIRVLIFAFGPIVWNAAVLIVGFLTSLFLGPMLTHFMPRFPAFIAATVHCLAVIGLLAFFEFIWYLERWRVANIVIGMLAAISIQRAFFKIIISGFLTREFKNDESNRAWWSGKWWSTGLGWHAISQPLREFLVKVVECSLFAADLILCHIILIGLSLPLLIPFVDKIHSTGLFWLRPSKQIRPPIFSFKVRAQRRSIVLRYSLIYLTVVCGFAALIIVPLVIKNQVDVTCDICQNI